MKKQSLRFYAMPAILVAVLLLPHLLFFGNQYVDIESLFVDSASRIATDGFGADLTNYFEVDANPILTSLIFSVGYKLFSESPIVSRLMIFLLSFAFIFFIFFYLRPRIGSFASFLTALLVSVNPMFIIYSQYVAADVDFMIFSSIALLFLIFPYSSKAHLASSIMFGVSLATKYAAIVLMPVVFIISLVKSGILERFSSARAFSLLRFNIWYFAIVLLVALPIILIVFRFQNSLMPSREMPINLSASMFIPRFFSYLIWLGLFIGPSSLAFALSLWKRIGKPKCLVLFIGLVALTLVVSLFFPPHLLVVEKGPYGEMNFGGIQSEVPPHYLSPALFVMLLVAELFVAHALVEIIDLWPSRDESIKSLLFWGLIPIPLMAVNRAANRYMLFVLVPISIYMAHVMGRMYSERDTRSFVLAVSIAHALIFLAVGFYSNYYLQQRGLAG